jgi:hypothetical protein
MDGEWDIVLTRLYSIFDSDFKKGKPSLNKMPVWWDNRVEEGDKYEEGFWHLISRNDQRTKERLFDTRRAERLPWCCPMLCHADDHAVIMWDYQEGRRLRTYVWLKDYDYVAVLERRRQRIGEVAFLITAYHIDGPSQKKSLERKYLQSKDKMQSPPI